MAEEVVLGPPYSGRGKQCRTSASMRGLTIHDSAVGASVPALPSFLGIRILRCRTQEAEAFIELSEVVG